ncbi:hypothetical protein AVEN_60413-1, partial [Araneus ventricosus]
MHKKFEHRWQREADNLGNEDENVLETRRGTKSE